jgi:hypothetical protein
MTYTRLLSPNRYNRVALLATIWLSIAAAPASARILSDGDFEGEETPIGSAPDANEAAGAWEMRNAREDVPTRFSIVDSPSLGPDLTGHSMKIRSAKWVDNYVHNHFLEPVRETEGEIVRARFDLFVPDSGTNTRGGTSITIGGDHGGGGHSTVKDRGPQVRWDSQGKIVTVECVGDCNSGPNGKRHVTRMRETPLNVWQNVQLDIDLVTDMYDLFWATNGELPELVASNIRYRSEELDFLDRFTVALFNNPPSAPIGDVFLDNVDIEVRTKLPGDTDLDGEVTFADFLVLADNFGGRRKAWSQGDFDGDREVGFPDFLALSANFGGAANSSAAAVPEPTGACIALLGILGLIGFRKRRQPPSDVC